MKTVRFGLLLVGAGCSTPGDAAAGGQGDLSWLGGVIGVVLGFGLFFLAAYRLSRK
jgi:hypothetical protein